jgi:hypothetical protein
MTKNKYVSGTAVSINSYTNENPYICPNDGYARVTANNDEIAFSGGGTLIQGNGKDISVFLKKGTRIYALNGSGSATTALFLPLTATNAS